MKILILSGPTHEYIDPVRYIGNASSGKMGKAIADEAVLRGHEVEFISGPVAESLLPDVGSGRLHKVTSADEMLACAREYFPSADAAIFAAAVADYTPAEPLAEKITRSTEEMVLRLRPTPDLARILCAGKSAGQVAIGFALQTHDAEMHARRKLAQKKLSGIVLNTPATLGAETGYFRFLSQAAETFEDWGGIDKTVCARRIMAAAEQLRSRQPD
jgi:phosphopantothenoylcysteine decarboxylase/phosphopantothenate--cysteine ligase